LRKEFATIRFKEQKEGIMANTLILYGSLTGNTQSVAEKIQSICQSKGKEVEVKNIADADAQDLTGPHSCLIFASSTWDDGHLQADWADFMERTANQPIDLTGKKVAIFGCGDSNYSVFCGAVEVLEQEFLVKRHGEKLMESLKIDGFPDMTENQTAIQAWAEQLANVLP
jgi:flavodoxin short chain